MNMQWNITHHKKNEIKPFVATWMDLEVIILGDANQRERQISEDTKGYKWTYLQSGNRLTDIENKFKVTKAETGGGIN